MEDAWCALDLRDVTGRQAEGGRRLYRLDRGKIYKAGPVGGASGRLWRVEQMQRSRTLYPIQGVNNEQCEPLTVRELTMGQLEWIQMLVDGLNGYIVRVVIGERVAYLEEQIMTPDGENIALSRVEEWESVTDGGSQPLIGALYCQLSEDQSALEADVGEGGDARIYVFHRLQARDLLTPSPLGKVFLDSLLAVRSGKLDGGDYDDGGNSRALVESNGYPWGGRRPTGDLPSAKRARTDGPPEGRPVLNLSSPKTEDGEGDGEGTERRPSGMLARVMPGGRRSRGAFGGARGFRGAAGARGYGRGARGASYEDDGGDGAGVLPGGGGAKIVQSNNQHCQVVMAPEDHVGRSIAPSIGRMVEHLVDSAVGGNTEAFEDLLRLCRVLPSAPRQEGNEAAAAEMAEAFMAARQGEGEGDAAAGDGAGDDDAGGAGELHDHHHDGAAGGAHGGGDHHGEAAAAHEGGEDADMHSHEDMHAAPVGLDLGHMDHTQQVAA